MLFHHESTKDLSWFLSHYILMVSKTNQTNVFLQRLFNSRFCSLVLPEDALSVIIKSKEEKKMIWKWAFTFTDLNVSCYIWANIWDIIIACFLASSGPPRVSDKVEHRQTARVGSAIKLPCPVEGDPPPLKMWTKDARNIHSGWIRFRILRMGLKIKEVETDDAGTYICKATNGFGSVNVNYTLIVIGECGRSSVWITCPSAGSRDEIIGSQKNVSFLLMQQL